MEFDKVTKRIFSNSRMELEFFMHLPTGIRGYNNTSLSINCNPVMYLRYKKNPQIAEEYDYAKAAFKITPRNIYHVIKFFNTIVTWLFDEKYNDLFLIDEDGNIVFNADYNKLSVSTPRGDYDQHIMQAVPTIVRIGDKSYEGIHLYVNTSSYCIPLTFQEVSIIFGILKNFSFTNEVSNILLAYDFIVRNNAYQTQDNRFNGKTPFD